MNRTQRIVLLVAAVSIVVMVLFPPFTDSFSSSGSTYFSGYSFIGNPKSGRVEAHLLAVQIAATLVVAGLVVLAFSTPRR